MTCTKAQVILLLEKIAEEMHDPRDREVVLQYAEKIKKAAWNDIIRELF